MNKIKYLSMLSLSVVAFSCNKNQDQKVNSNAAPKNNTSIISTSFVDASNSENPYDNVGLVFRNEVGVLINAVSGVTNESQRNEICRSYLLEEMQGVEGAEEFINEEIGFLATSNVNYPTYNEMLAFYQVEGSSKFKEYSKTMFVLSNNAIGQRYNNFRNSYIQLEHQILNDNTLASDERECLLTFASLERYFYSTYIDGSSGGSNEMIPMMGCRTPKPLAGTKYLKKFPKGNWPKLKKIERVQ